MASRFEVRPGFREREAKLLQGGMPALVRERARPYPLHTQRRFSPTLSPFSVYIGDRQTNPSAGHARNCFRAELQRNAILNRKEIEARRGYLDVSWFSLRHAKGRISCESIRRSVRDRCICAPTWCTSPRSRQERPSQPPAIASPAQVLRHSNPRSPADGRGRQRI